MRPLRAALPLLFTLTMAWGCAAPAVEDVSQSGGAISGEEAAKQFEFAELVVPETAASKEVQALGVKSWTAYSASKQSFLGLVLFASDAEKDVEYMLLVNARRGADGKTHVMAFQLDKAGKQSPLDAATLKTLTGDMNALNARAQARARSEATNSGEAKCAIGLTKVAFGVLLGAGLIYVAAPAVAGVSMAAEFAPVLASVPLIAKGAGLTIMVATAIPGAAMFFTSVAETVNGTFEALDNCGASSG